MRSFKISLLITILILGGLAKEAPAGTAQGEEQKWLAILESDSPKAQKAIACKRLAIYGTAKSVPALAKLLPDPQLSSWARIALEAIPAPEADKALRESLKKLKGRVLVGVINSIGVRADKGSVPQLIQKLGDPDMEVAEAAAVALGHIGTASAREALTEALKKARESKLRSAIAEGCVLCAEKLLSAGSTKEAYRIYELLRNSDLPTQRIVEATRGSILCLSGKKRRELLLEQLLSPNKHLFLLGLKLSRELSGKEVTEALLTAFKKAPPSRQARLLYALADRKDPECIPAIISAASSKNKTVRLTAIELLADTGDPSCLPKLIEAAMEKDPQVAKAAKLSLTKIRGRGVDRELVRQLGRAKGRSRLFLIEIVGARGIKEATEELKKLLHDPNSEIRQASLLALGSSVGFEDLDLLIDAVLKAKNMQDLEVAQKALRTACLRMPDREACALKIVEGIRSAREGTKAFVRKKVWDRNERRWRWVAFSPETSLLNILGALGGKAALKEVSQAALSEDPELRETALEVLSSWLSPEAASSILDSAKSARDPSSRKRALQAFAKLLGGFKLSEEKALKLYRRALSIALRPDEKILVIESMKRHPSLGVLRLVSNLLQEPLLKKEAYNAALFIAQKIGAGKEIFKLLKKKPVKIEILSAEYGAGKKFVNVTGILKRYVRDLPVIVLPLKSYNQSFGVDPVPGTVKVLRIHYRINGKEGKAEFTENAPIVLPMP